MNKIKSTLKYEFFFFHGNFICLRFSSTRSWSASPPADRADTDEEVQIIAEKRVRSGQGTHTVNKQTNK